LLSPLLIISTLFHLPPSIIKPAHFPPPTHFATHFRLIGHV
jgi:hypothetical protein